MDMKKGSISITQEEADRIRSKQPNWRDLGYDPFMRKKEVVEDQEKSHKRQIEQEEHETRMLSLKLQQQNELQKAKQLKNQLHNATPKATLIRQELIDAIPVEKDKRLKSVKKIATLYVFKDIVSDFEIVKCIVPSLAKRNYSKKKYAGRLLTRLKTIKKYWKPLRFTLIRSRVPVLGYELKKIK